MYKGGTVLTYKTKKLIWTCVTLLMLGVLVALIMYLWYLKQMYEINSLRDLFLLIRRNIIATGPNGLPYKVYRFVKSMHWSGWHWAVLILGFLSRIFFKIVDATPNIVDRIALLVYEVLLIFALSGFLVRQNLLLWAIIAVINAARFIYFKVDADDEGCERVLATVALAFTFLLIFAGLHAFNVKLLSGFVNVDFFRIYNWVLLIGVYCGKMWECITE